MALEHCEDCRLWQRNEDGDTRSGVCRLYPPVIVDTTSTTGAGVRPNMREFDGCGQWVGTISVDSANLTAEDDDTKDMSSEGREGA